MSKRARGKATAVEMRCPKGDLIATVCPYPALGHASRLDIEFSKARYRAGISTYLTGVAADDDDDRGWVTVKPEPMTLSLNEFNHPGWARSATWACKCGLQQVAEQEVISAVHSCSAKREMGHGTPPKPEQLFLTRRTSMPK
jgi:hypothetical protein